jgi:hypothetical protein
MPFVLDLDPVAFSVLGLHVRWYGIIVASPLASPSGWRPAMGVVAASHPS